MRWLFSRNEVRSEQVGVSRFSYEPGARMPFGHRHGVQEEVYVVVAGSGRAKLEDEIIEIGLWDVLRVAPDRSRERRALACPRWYRRSPANGHARRRARTGAERSAPTIARGSDR